jgi:dephospho-CoA kinase
VRFIGLTGGIGSGKSEALAAAERLGAAVLSSDAVVHELLETDDLKSRLVDRWGEAVLRDGHVDRDAIAGIVFGRPEELAWLEQTVFPLVGLRTAAWREQVEREGTAELAVVEVPLLFEAEIEGGFDATIAVVADEQLRSERAGGRNHEGLEGRGARQLSQQEKAERADFVIHNDHSLEHLEQRVGEVFDQIKAARQ